MSASIDTRIVEMKFDNTQFEQGVRQTLSSLQSLEKGMKLDGAAKGLAAASKGLNDISESGKRFNLGNIGQAVDNIAGKFKAMSVIGISALATLSSQAASYGMRIAQGIFSPIKDGLGEYETNLNAIQTILANTQSAGSTLKDVNGALSELNTYSDKTIYNFSEMARNIGTFTAAGVDLKTATGSIKGIANLAALSGSNSQQASTAMYQLSQAISSGRVSLQDWNSVVNAGMGGTVFQRALAQNAEKMGTLSKGAVKLTGKMKNVSIAGKSFRESITAEPGKESWLTSEVLTKTLQQFTGDLTDAQLKAQGFSDAQIKAIQAQAKTAQDAATQVKTMSQLFGTLKESAGSGWAQTWQLIFGDFGEAKKMWTDVNNVLGGMINASSTARNKLLGDWKALGGRTVLISGIKNAFQALMAIIKPIRDAFRSIFPATTGKQLYEMTLNFAKFTKSLKIGGDTAKNLKRTFAGVFAIFDIGWQIFKKLVRIVMDVFGAFSGGDGSILKTTAGIGDFFVALDKAIKKGEGFNKFFEKLRQIIAIPLNALNNLKNAFFGLFSGVDASSLDTLNVKFGKLKDFGTSISEIWGKVMSNLDNVAKVFGPLGQKFADFFRGMGDKIAGMFQGVDFGRVLDIINTGLFAGLVLLFKKFTGSAEGGIGSIKDALKSIISPFDALTGTLDQMQKTLKATQLLQLAAAIGIMALAVVQLSRVDEKGLKRALGAMTVMFVQLAAGMKAFEKINTGKGMGQLILMALALKVLASSVTQLSKLNWEELGRGLSGTAALLAILAAAARAMPDGKKMISSSTGLILMATAVKILVGAVTDLSGLSWEELQKGLVAVGAVLGSLALFTRLSAANKGGIAQGAGIILLAVGIRILTEAIQDMSKMSWEEIGKGVAVLAGSLAAIAGALKLIPPSSILSAAAILVVATSLSQIGDAIIKMGALDGETIGKGLGTLAGALVLVAGALALLPPTSLLSAAAIFVVASSLSMITDALGTMGGMSMEEIGKGLGTLAGALAIIALAMAGMTTALLGAAALIVVAGALAILTPIIVTLGNLSWEQIGKGLGVLAAALAIIGVAGALITPVIPSLLGLGIAIGLLGAGVALAGAGVLAFSLGLTALAAAGAGATAAIVAIVSGLIGLIPTVMEQIGLGLVAFAQVIATAGPAIMQAITVVLNAILNAIIAVTPKVGQLMLVLLATLLRVLVQGIPMIVRAGMQLIIGILNGIAAKIGQVVTAATNVIVAFLNGISKNIKRIIDAGVNLIISFVNGMANSIREHQKEMSDAGKNLAGAIIDGMTGGLRDGVNAVINAAKGMAKSALDAAKNLLGIHSPSREFAKVGKYSAEGFAKGLTGSKDQINAAYKTMRDLVSQAMAAERDDIDKLEARLAKLNKARKKDKDAIRQTSLALAQARAELKKTTAASKLVNSWGDETKKLGIMSDQLKVVGDKLKAANDKLADAKKTRDDYNKSVKDQYANLPDFQGDTKLADYITGLEKKVADTQIFSAQLQKLRDLGLNDEMYKELLAKGPDAIPFVTQILDGGKAAVNQINTLDSSLNKAATSLADSASKALYQAAVDSAAGLVKGLEAQQKNIEKQMDKIADAMVKAIKKKLGIKSPSREFMKVGKWSNEGLAKGLEDAREPIKAAENVGHGAIDAMRKTLTGLSDVMVKDIDSNPTIKPVLDLSDVKRGAGNIGGMLTTKPLEVGGAYSLARSAAAEINAARESSSAVPSSDKGGTTLNLTQNNYSPKAISAADNYRNTKNLLSTTKNTLSRRGSK